MGKIPVFDHHAAKKTIIGKLIFRDEGTPLARRLTIDPAGVYTHCASTATCPE
jgi:hypothetical protein